MATYSAGEAQVVVAPDMSTLRERIEAGFAAIDLDLEVALHPDMTAFAAEMQAHLETIEAEIHVPVSPDMDDFAAKMRAGLAAQRFEATVRLNADFDDLERRFRERLSDFDDPTTTKSKLPDSKTSKAPVEVPVKPKMDVFQEDLLKRLSVFAKETELRIPATADGERLRQQLRAEVAALEQQIRVELPVDPEVSGEARARMLAELNELTRRRSIDVDVDVDRSAVASLAAVGSSADRSRAAALALNAVKFGALIAAAGAAAAAIGGIAGAAGGAISVLGAVGAAGIVGFQGIGGAFSAMKKASDDAGQAAKDTAKEQEAAADRVREAQQRVKDSIQAQDDAQKRLQATQDTARQKQLALNDAYKDASRSLQDMNDRLRDAELSQESAAIGLARAQERRAQLGSGASALDRAEADLNVRQAQARLDSTRKDTARQQQDTATANSKGVEGSDQVTSAKANLQSAYDDVTQAQRNVDSTARATADAQRELTRALRDQAEAAKSGGASADAFAQALAKLSPNARQFVLAMQALGPQMTAFKNAIQDRLFDGLGQSVTTFVKTNLPMLQTGLGQVATYMNGAFKDTLSQLTATFRTLAADGTFAQLGTSIQSALSGIAPLVNGVVVSFSRMGAEMSTTLGPLFQSLGQMLADIGGPLGQLGASFAASVTSLLPVLGQFVGMLAQGLTPIMPVLSQLLQTLGTALMPIIPTLSGFIVAFGQALNSVLAAVAPLLPPLVQLLSAILKPLIGVIKTVADAMAPFIKQLAEQMKPVIDKLAPVLAEVGKILGQALAEAFKQLAPLLGPLVAAFLKLIEACLPLLPAWEEMAVQLLPPMVELMRLLIPIVTKLIELFASFVKDVVVPHLIPMLKQVSQHFKDLGTDVRDFVDGAKQKWDSLVGFVKDLPARISRAASGMWDGVKDTFKSALNWIIQRWNDFHISMKVPDSIPLIGGKGFTIDTPDLPMLAGGGSIASRDETGLLSGPGNGTSDSILGVNAAGVPVVRVADQERVTNARSSVANAGLLTAINAANGPFDMRRYMGLPGLASGGSVPDAMFALAQKRWPSLQLTSGLRNSNDNHGRGLAADISNGTGNTPEMLELANWIADNFPGSMELIHDNPKFTRQIKNGKFVGGGGGSSGFYAGAGDHTNHVHWAMATPPVEPAPPATPPAPAPAAPAVAAPAPEVSSATAPLPTGAATDGVGTTNGVSEVATTGAAEQKSPFATLLGGSSGSIGDTIGGVLKSFVGGQIDDAAKTVLGTSDAPGIVKFGMTIGSSIKQTDTKSPTGTPTTADAASTDTKTATPQADAVSTPPANPTPAAPPAAPPAPAKIEYNPAGGVEQWRPLVERVLVAKGQSPNLADKVLRRMNQESSGNPKAINNEDINAQNGTPSKGLMQVIDPTFQAYKDPGFDDNWDPEANLRASMNYALARYGSLQAAYDRAGGYADGGSLNFRNFIKPLQNPSGGQALAAPAPTTPGILSGPGGPRSDGLPLWGSPGEYVVNAVSAQANRALLDGLNRDANFVNNSQVSPPTAVPQQQQAPATQQTVMQGRGGTTYVFNVSSVDEALAKARVEDAKSSLGLLSR